MKRIKHLGILLVFVLLLTAYGQNLKLKLQRLLQIPKARQQRVNWYPLSLY